MFTLTLSCGIPNWFVVINSEEESMLLLISHVFGSMLSDGIGYLQHSNSCIINISIHDNNYFVIYKHNGKQNFECSTNTDVVFLLYQLLELYTDSISIKNCSIFHGSLITKSNRAFGLSAPTRTGKSTLTAYLCSHGFQFLSDDYIIVDRISKSVSSFTLPITLRSKEVLPLEANGNVLFEGYNKYKGELNYLFMNTDSSMKLSSNKLNSMIFLCRCDENLVSTLSKGESYKMLILNLKYTKELELERVNMINFVNDISCYSLLYSDMSYAKNAIELL